MRVLISILTVCASMLLLSSANSQERATTARNRPTDESAKKVKDLQKERILVLKELTEQLTGLYKNACVPFEEVLEARQRLCEAELDAAATEEKRIEL